MKEAALVPWACPPCVGYRKIRRPLKPMLLVPMPSPPIRKTESPPVNPSGVAAAVAVAALQLVRLRQQPHLRLRLLLEIFEPQCGGGHQARRHFCAPNSPEEIGNPPGATVKACHSPPACRKLRACRLANLDLRRIFSVPFNTLDISAQPRSRRRPYPR